MSSSIPGVVRYNKWREWKPIQSTLNMEEHSKAMLAALAIRGNELEAAHNYTAHTGFDGIEFVVIGSYKDKAPFRKLAHGIVLVPCADVLEDQSNPTSMLGRTRFLYDGWLPLTNTSLDGLREGLRWIDETIAMLTYSLRSSATWFPKYIETCPKHGEYRSLQDSDECLFADATTDFAMLPEAVRDAVSRAAHWLQHGQQQRRSTDTFLSYWLAFESLILTLFDVGPEVGLVIEDEYEGMSKKARKSAKGRAILELIDPVEEKTASELVSRAYFDIVTGIGKRVRKTLPVVLGEGHQDVDWPYTAKLGIEPTTLRSNLVHGGLSATELETRYDLVTMCSELELLTREIIHRTLHQLWGVEVEKRRYQFVETMSVTNMIVCGSPRVEVHGDFSMTWGLLASKGLVGQL